LNVTNKQDCTADDAYRRGDRKQNPTKLGLHRFAISLKNFNDSDILLRPVRSHPKIDSFHTNLRRSALYIGRHSIKGPEAGAPLRPIYDIVVMPRAFSGALRIAGPGIPVRWPLMTEGACGDDGSKISA
jgi:hypothetical protein